MRFLLKNNADINFAIQMEGYSYMPLQLMNTGNCQIPCRSEGKSHDSQRTRMNRAPCSCTPRPLHYEEVFNFLFQKDRESVIPHTHRWTDTTSRDIVQPGGHPEKARSGCCVGSQTAVGAYSEEVNNQAYNIEWSNGGRETAS
jgi:hypothetical protein